MPLASNGASRALAAALCLAPACTGGAPANPSPASFDSGSAANAPSPQGASKPASSGFALVELFTSEGCSSCPPADASLEELANDAERRGLRVFALSFHVDYWNTLGWPDPFSAPAYTSRQEAYASLARARGVYTPQMIVNGGEGFIGSDLARARREVDRALGASPPSPAALSLRAEASGPSVRVELDARALPPGDFLNVALVEKARVQKVPRGENAGLTLRHRNVVRAFETLTPRGPGPYRVDLPAEGLDPSALSVVAYAQDPATLAVLGAEAAPVKAP